MSETLAIRTTDMPRPSRQRSRVTNGKSMFVRGRGTSPWARRWRDLTELHAMDAAQGAPLSTLTQAQISLCKRVATIEIELEQAEGKLSMGEVVDLDVYARATGHLRRALETLASVSLQRAQRDVTRIEYEDREAGLIP
jgi:hypothetical protein